jgi:recombination protein RecA
MSRIPERDRQRAIQLKLARMQNARPIASLSTGFATLDAALGTPGLPRGSIVELFGPSCGKTTLALQIVAHTQRNGAIAAWIDADRTFDPAYAARLGVSIEQLPVVRPESAEQALEIACRLAVSGAVELVVIDSAAALVPGLELDAAIGESGPGLHGRVLASGLRKLAGISAKAGTTVLCLNQVRMRMDASGARRETSAGGSSLKLYAAVRVALEAGAGGRLRFRVLKNKAAAAFGEGKLGWSPGRGFVETP